MKKLSAFISVILCILMIFSSVSVMAFADNANAESEIEGKTNLLLIGDSIAEGFGIANPNEASYGRIVADTFGWNYRNTGRSATDTGDLIYRIENNPGYCSDIAWADIINVCIGSNNYLANPDVVKIAVGALFGVNNSQLDEIAEGIREDYDIIYSMIREINPDAKIIINRIYCAWGGLGHIIFSKAVNRINACIDDFAASHNDVMVFDLDIILTHKNELIADDCVHPNAKGNVEMAKAMVNLLSENGLCEKTELVISAEGIDYNYYQDYFGKFQGTLICIIVKTLTLCF